MAEGRACAQVVQRYGGYGVDGLQVEVGLDGRTTEYDGAAGVENKVLANDVLQRELINAMVYGVRAIHGEVSFIIIVGADVSVSVQGDVVTGFRIHKNLHGSFRCQVEAEIDTHVRFRLRKGGAAWGMGMSVDTVLMGLVGDKLVVCQSRRRGQVVDEHGVFFGAGIDVDVQVARLSVEPDFSGGGRGWNVGAHR